MRRGHTTIPEPVMGDVLFDPEPYGPCGGFKRYVSPQSHGYSLASQLVGQVQQSARSRMNRKDRRLIRSELTAFRRQHLARVFINP